MTTVAERAFDALEFRDALVPKPRPEKAPLRVVRQPKPSVCLDTRFERVFAEVCPSNHRKRHVIGPSKNQALCWIRFQIMWRLVIDEDEPLTLKQAGMKLGNRDHSTVFYGCRMYSAKHFGTSMKATIDEMRRARG